MINNCCRCRWAVIVWGVAAWMLAVSTGTSAEWKVLEKCTYVPNDTANDGDSFWIQHNKKKMKFRLYFVDTPETTDEEDWAKARLNEQAEYFNSDPETIRKVGLDAKKFTQKTLSHDKEFTVYTRMEEAMGRGKQRYYAMVEVDGRFLSELLVENGFVRINKKTMVEGPLPNKWSVDKYEDHLRHLEHEAKNNGLGGWASKSGSSMRNTTAGVPAQQAASLPAVNLEPRVLALKRTLPVYSLLTPGKLVRLLPPNTKIKVVGAAEESGMAIIRFNIVEGIIHEAQCQARDL